MILEPILDDVPSWFAELDRLVGPPFPDGGAEQPPMPPDEDLFG